jgi:hypothetical protein
MFLLLNLLIVLFIVLIGTQIFLAHSGNIIEGIKNNSYQEYDGNDALILSKQNAANIEFLKQKFDGINELQNEVGDISGNVAALQTQVDGLVQGQQDYANNVTSSNSELSTSYDEEPDDTNNTDMTNPDTINSI